MKTRLLLAHALPRAVFDGSSHTPRAVLALLSSAVLFFFAVNANAQSLQPRQVRRLAPPRSTEVAGGSRVTIISDAALDDYTAYSEAGRFHVLIPQAQLTSAASALSGAGFTGVRAEQKGGDVDLSFTLAPAAKA